MNFKNISFLLMLLSVSFFSCSNSVENSITFENNALGDMLVNFRGSKVDVPSGSSVTLSDIDKGEFQYETIYELPPGTTGSSLEGEGAGTFIMKAGTKVLVIYTSTFLSGTYTVYVSVTSSDDQTEDEDPNPIGP